MLQYGSKFMDAEAVARAQQTFMTKVYTWMFGGLFVTAITSLYMVMNDWAVLIASSSFFWVLFIAQFGLVIALSAFVEKMSKPVAIGAFFLYALLNGITFSVIFLVYTSSSIYSTFLIASLMFGGLSLWGYTTKRNLNGFGAFFQMGLFGLIGAIVINFILGSDLLSFIISVVGVIVFTGLTAYDTQKIKEMYMAQFESDTIATKGAIMGALVLYLDFINLFLYLLRLFGRRN